jgi:2-C-methyl-D-erythritol 4-phosphate cytidylyltransferase
VIEVDRGSLPFTLIHGEALVACASWALDEAQVTQVDLATEWSVVADTDDPFVLHDSLCPMTPPAFLVDCVGRAVEGDCVVVGVRPVTDTVKEVAGGVVGDTVDRSTLWSVASPIVLPATAVPAMEQLSVADFAALVEALRSDHRVELVEAPASAARVSSEDDVRRLEALTEGGGRRG